MLEVYSRFKLLGWKELPSVPDSADFITVFQNQYGITRSDLPNPVLKTCGLGPCVSLLLHHTYTRLTAMGHSTHVRLDSVPIEKKAHDDLLEIWYALLRNGLDSGDRARIKPYIITSTGTDLAQGFIEKVNMFELAEPEVIIEPNFSPLSIAFDSRSGSLYKLTDSLPRTESKLDDMFDQFNAMSIYNLTLTSDNRSLK